MLRLPIFQHHRPESVEAAVALAGELGDAGEDYRFVAGGTDLFPNMKHGLASPTHVISLGAIGLGEIAMEKDEIRIGAMTSLHAVSQSELIHSHLPALASACRQIAGPQLRNMGTLGGNICLDTRCLYINQTAFWREALGYCLKKDGDTCHVIKGGKRCVAAASNDSVLPLWLYGARLELVSPSATRVIPLSDFFVADGVKNTVIAADEILTQVIIPKPSSSLECRFEKLRMRKDIDFSLVNLAVAWELNPKGEVSSLRAVIGALGAKPKSIDYTEQAAGRKLDAPLIQEFADKIHRSCKPLTNIATDVNWRRRMLKVLATRILS